MRLLYKKQIFMECYKEIYYASNTIKKLHIQSNLNSGYIHNFYHDKKGSIDDMFYQYHIPLLKDIDHPALIQEWKKNLNASAYEKI